MKKLTAATTLALFVGTGAALANFSVGDQVGTTEDQVRAALETQGAVIDEIESEDGRSEVEFFLNGVEMEVAVDVTSGAITEIDTDEEDGEDHDDSNDDD